MHNDATEQTLPRKTYIVWANIIYAEAYFLVMLRKNTNLAEEFYYKTLFQLR